VEVAVPVLDGETLPNIKQQPHTESPFYACSRCERLFQSWSGLTQHVLARQDIPCWRTMYPTYKAASIARQQRQLYLKTLSLSRKIPGLKQELKFPQSNTADGTASMSVACRTCKEGFPNKTQLDLHHLMSDTCSDQEQPGGYICFTCKIPLPTKEEAKAHAENRTNCRHTMTKIRDPERQSMFIPEFSPKWKAVVLTMAKEKYRLTTHLLLKIARHQKTPISLVNKIRDHLQQVEKEANQENYIGLLDLFADDHHKLNWNHNAEINHQKKVEKWQTKNRTKSNLGLLNEPPSLAEPGENTNFNAVEYLQGKKPHPGMRKVFDKAAFEPQEFPKDGTSAVKSTANVKPEPVSVYDLDTSLKQQIALEYPTEDTNNVKSTVDVKSKPVPLDNLDTSLKQQIALLVEQLAQLTRTLNISLAGGEAVNLKHGPHLSNDAKQTKKKDAEGVSIAVESASEGQSERQKSLRSIHTQAGLMKSSNGSETLGPNMKNRGNGPVTLPAPVDTTVAATASAPARAGPPTSTEISDQSLMQELFPEGNIQPKTHNKTRDTYPKLDLPSHSLPISYAVADPPKSARERLTESFQSRGEHYSALQLLHCSTELTETDFRRLVPKGKHILSWTRRGKGEFVHVIPGRDPLSLERLPFYYLVFRSPESALAYQKNALRLHKLNQLHQPQAIFSAIAPPKGFLEDGEDIAQATASYVLMPPDMPLSLSVVMQPYNPALRALFNVGGYKPIMPPVSPNTGQPVFKVLMQIDGYEPLPNELFRIIRRDGYKRGITWPLHNGEKGISRLRDIVDSGTRFHNVTTPRAANPRNDNWDPFADSLEKENNGVDDEGKESQQISQHNMARVYNRWMIEFDEEEAARRFARMWNRRILPVPKTWKDFETKRMCNVEFLW
jgi:hypothetical protein